MLYCERRRVKEYTFRHREMYRNKQREREREQEEVRLKKGWERREESLKESYNVRRKKLRDLHIYKRKEWCIKRDRNGESDGESENERNERWEEVSMWERKRKNSFDTEPWEGAFHLTKQHFP